VFASWNGATAVTAWQVVAGARPGALRPLARVPKGGFETRIAVRTGARYLAVRALGAGGRVLRASRPLVRAGGGWRVA